MKASTIINALEETCYRYGYLSGQYQNDDTPYMLKLARQKLSFRKRLEILFVADEFIDHLRKLPSPNFKVMYMGEWESPEE